MNEPKKTTAVQAATTTAPDKPSAGKVVAQKTGMPECRVLKRLDDPSPEGILSTIEGMTGDADFAKKFVYYAKLQVKNNWRRDGSGKWYNLFDKVPLESVLEALFSCARRKVLPDGYNAYLVVYLGKNPRCQLLVDYKGICDTAIAENICTDIGAKEACENDELEIDFGEVTRFHINPKAPRGEVIGCVAWAILPNGKRKSVFVELEELEKIRRCAQSDNIWRGWTNEMYKKSAIRRLFKTMQNTPRMRALIDIDNDDFDPNKAIEEVPKGSRQSPVRSLAGSSRTALPAPEEANEAEAVEAEAVPAEEEQAEGEPIPERVF